MKKLIVIVLLSFVVPVLAQSSNYESHAANLGALKIHYLRAGTGKKTLVLIHGFGDTSHMWIPLFDEFGKDYTIIAPDMRGLGESSRPAGCERCGRRDHSSTFSILTGYRTRRTFRCCPCPVSW